MEKEIVLMKKRTIERVELEGFVGFVVKLGEKKRKRVGMGFINCGVWGVFRPLYFHQSSSDSNKCSSSVVSEEGAREREPGEGPFPGVGAHGVRGKKVRVK
jgi:hypothetical protein